MKQQLADLWKTSFGDSDDFIRLFFDRIYREENALTLCENGRITAALHMIPCEMTCCGGIVPVAYVCGACTLPSERGKGRMSRLMKQATEVMRNRGDSLAVLIPASDRLYGFYARFGFVEAFSHTFETHVIDHLPAPTSDCRIVSARDLPSATAYACYDRLQRKHTCATLHSAYDWETILLDCRLEGGDAWVAFRDGKPEGVAIAVPQDESRVYVKEILCEQPDIRNTLIRSVLTHFRRSAAQVRIRALPYAAQPGGMACLLDAKRMTDLYISFHRPADVSLLRNADSRRLTQIILGYDRQEAWMNLMLD
ncbi:MAG: GNAT family N-acetyltransferase [Tannerella sp.]|nr:GNAT family N-acetyltransferase [Tannerella sp.]